MIQSVCRQRVVPERLFTPPDRCCVLRSKQAVGRAGCSGPGWRTNRSLDCTLATIARVWLEKLKLLCLFTLSSTVLTSDLSSEFSHGIIIAFDGEMCRSENITLINTTTNILIIFVKHRRISSYAIFKIHSTPSLKERIAG